jgi:hypothetical protein
MQDSGSSTGMAEPLTDAFRAALHGEGHALSVALDNRVTGLLATTDADCTNAHRQAVNTSLAADDTAVQVVRRLRAAGVDHRVLKGVAHAALDYTDPAQRTYGDCDVLVPRADLQRALDVLQQAGLRRRDPAIRDSWEQRFGKSVELVGLPVEVDLHLTIAGGGFGLIIEMASLWESPERFMLAGTEMLALSPLARWVHACYHLALGANAGLRAMADIVVMLDRGLDWQEAVLLAHRWRGAAVVAHALVTTEAWISDVTSAQHDAFEWARRYRASDADRLRIDASSASGAPWPVEGRAALGALPWRHRLPYVAGLVWPTADSLAARQRTRVDHVRRVLTGSL